MNPKAAPKGGEAKAALTFPSNPSVLEQHPMGIMRKISEGICIFMGGELILVLLSFSLKPQRAGAAASFPSPHLGIVTSFPAGIPSQRSSRIPSCCVSSCGSSQFHGGTQGIDSHPWLDVCYHPWQESPESLEFNRLITSIKRAVKPFSIGFFLLFQQNCFAFLFNSSPTPAGSPWQCNPRDHPGTSQRILALSCSLSTWRIFSCHPGAASSQTCALLFQFPAFLAPGHTQE